MKMRKFSIVTEYWRWTLGGAIIAISNFAILATQYAQKLSEIFGINEDKIVLMVVMLTFLGAWGIGYALDRMGYQQGMVSVNVARNPVYQEILQRLERIEKAVEKNEISQA